MMSYKPRKLGHVNIFVRNAERARDWYEDPWVSTPTGLRLDGRPS